MKQKFFAWLRQSQTWGFFVSVAVMAIIAILFFAPDNFNGNSLNQADMTQGIANGEEARAYQEATGEKALWTNSLFSGMPTFQISPSYPSNGMFAWINSLYGGFLPAPSNYLFMMMLGFLVLLYCMRVRWWVALVGAIAWAFSSYYIIIIGAGHIWKLLTLSYIPPTIGGIILCYRGRYWLGGGLTALFAMMQLYSNHPQMSYYFAFVMAGVAIAALFDLAKAKKLKQWGIATGVIIVAGCLAVGANLPSIYHTYKYAKETQRGQSELAIFNQQPAEETGTQDPRLVGPPTGGMAYSQIVGWSYGRAEMFSLLIPNVKGGGNAKPIDGQMTFLPMSEVGGADGVSYADSQFLPYFSQYFNDSEGTNGPVYVGALICALFLLGCIVVRGPLKWVLVALTLLSCLLALGYNFRWFADLWIYHMPMFSKFRTIESILVIAEFTMPLLAVLALAKVAAPKGDGYEFVTAPPADKPAKSKPSKLLSMGLYVSFGLCLLICLAAMIAPGVFGSVITSSDQMVLDQVRQLYPENYNSLVTTLTDLRHGMIRADAWHSFIFIALGGALIWAYLRRSDNRTFGVLASVGVCLLVLADLFAIDKRYVSHESFVQRSFLTDEAAIPAALEPDVFDDVILQDKDLHYRVLDVPGLQSPNRSYRHKTIGGYHSAKLSRYDDLVKSGALLQPNVINMLNAKHVITGQQSMPYFENDQALGNGWFVDTLTYVDGADAEFGTLVDDLNTATSAVADKKFESVLGQATPVDSTDKITLTKYTPNTLTYTTESKRGGVGVFSEIYFPWGWKATVDGEPVEIGRANYVLRAVRLPAGKHELVMTFAPDSMRTTGAVAYACSTLVYLMVLMGLFMAFIRKEEEAKP